MRIQVLPRSTGSSRDFYKISLAVFIVIYVFLWLSKPLVKNELDLAGHKTSIRLRDIVAIDSISSSIVNESPSKEVADFTKHWCRQRRARRDWQAMILPCKNKMPWNSSRDIEKNATDPDASFISLWDIRPAGQYSRFSIQSQTKEGHPKLEGGDSWRVVIRGPSFISPTVIDHGNGTYEVLFLAMEAGVYKASVILDFTSCNGFKDPPVDWFIIGNVQGKYQRHPEVEGNKDYLQAPLWGGSPVELPIPPAKNANMSSISKETMDRIRSKGCQVKCNFLWDGYGRWVRNTWKPHFKDIIDTRPIGRKRGTLWVYGDSVNVFFAQSLVQRRICRNIFKRCNFSYNWIYPVHNVTAAKRQYDNLDYNNEKVLENFRRIVYDPQMDENSAIVLNFGLHFVESTNFTSYKKLIAGLVRVLKNDVTTNGTWRSYRGTVIWKTTTAINKEKASNIHLGHKRFITQQRILLYNSYATTQMCRAGFLVLDVFPITDSYPQGTGTHGAHGPVKNDIVHYSNLAFIPAEELLEEYFGGK
nr:uncharacterized protein LOC131782275 [Pocillopora verrucosa]